MDLARMAIVVCVLVGLGGMGLTFHFQNEYLQLNRARGHPDDRVGRGKAMPRTPEFHRDPHLREAWQRMIQRERWSIAVVIGGPLLGLFVAGLVRHSLL